MTSKNAMRIIVKSPSQSVRICVYGENTMDQILREYAEDLQVDFADPRFLFVLKRANTSTTDRNATVNDLCLQDGDELLIQDHRRGPDATSTFHFMVAYNTLRRLKKNALPRNIRDYHEMYVAASTKEGHEIKFYLSDSTLRDIVAPFLWMPEGYETTNYLTEGKRPVMIINERSGKCAVPSEFDMLISDFLEDNKEIGKIYIICEDEQETPEGMHIERFSFGDPR